MLTRVEAFVNSLKSDKVDRSQILTLKQCSDRAVHNTTNIKTKLEEVDKTTTLYLPHIYPYSHLLTTYLQTKGYRVRALPMTTQNTLNMGRKCTLSKEYLSYTGLVGDVLGKVFEIGESNEKYGFIIPTSEGSEVGGQYHRLIRDKLDALNLHHVEILSPFVEDIIKDSSISQDIFLILLGGDLINLALRSKRRKYLDELQKLIANNQLSIDSLKNLAKEIEKDRINPIQPKKIYVVGEVNILFNDFLNNNTFKTMEEQGIQLLYQPLSEYMWFLWRDYLAQQDNKKENLAHKGLTKLSTYIKTISEILVKANPFEEDLENLGKRADEHLSLYSGGNGRYRYAKALGNLKDVQGIITASSMYENTNTILNILSQGDGKTLGIPELNMTFDGNENEIDKSKIDSFIYYALQENDKNEASNKRGA